MNWLLEHRHVRRLITIPAMLGIFLVLVTTLPLWILAGAAVSPRLPGKWRPLRLLWFAVIYLGLQVTGLVAAGALWVASGFGRHLGRDDFQRRHYRLLRVLLDMLMHAARRAFELTIVIGAPSLPEGHVEFVGAGRPVLIFSRHAGPGDSFLLVHEVVSVYRRNPRIVLKNTLQWDPLVDVLLNRLPTRFISPNPPPGSGVADMIGVLAAGLTGDDALVIFPEGGNFTEARRLRAIERLESAGLSEFAERARAMRYVLPPRPSGAFSAIDAAPHADVLFVAHTGLEQLSTPLDLWRGLPMNADVRAQFWIVPTWDIPRERTDRMEWLYDGWEQIDAWIAKHRDESSGLSA